MTYRELLALYKKGELAEPEAAKVRSDIERQEAIAEYLCDAEEIFDIELPEDFSQSESEDFAKTINRSIKRAFRKLGIIVLVLALIMVLFVQFALPNIVSSFYYNPGKIVGTKEYRITNQMELNMAVYTSLMLPGYYRDMVSVTDRGYGNYDINIAQSVSFNNRFSDVSGKIEKGQSEYGDNAMNPASKYVVFVTLNQQMDYEDFIAWSEKEGIPGLFWCTPCTSESGYPQNLGFYYDFMYGVDMPWDKETYPDLFLDIGTDKDIDKEHTMLSHFTSQLRYLAAQEDFCEMISLTPGELSDAADYVEENGLRIYGFATLVNKEQAERIEKSENVFRISAQELI